VTTAIKSWAAQRKGMLTPVSFEANAKPRALGARISDWALRIHNNSMRRTYAWKRHTTSMMCWCPHDWQQSTHLW
jgi:hypothetical protein